MDFEIMLPVLIALILVVVVMLTTRRYRKSHSDYDEMQMMNRDKGYKVGFFTILIMLAVEIFASEIIGLKLMDVAMMLFIPLMTGVTIYACYSIVKGAFFAINDKGISYTVMIGVMALCNIATGVIRVGNGSVVKNGVITFDGAEALVMGIGFLIIAITSLIMMMKNRKETES